MGSRETAKTQRDKADESLPIEIGELSRNWVVSFQPLAPEGAAQRAGGPRAHDLAADGVAYEDHGERGVRGAG